MPQSPAPSCYSRAKVLRSFILEAIANSHAGLKSCWTVIFSAGTFNFILSLNRLGVCSGLVHGGFNESCQFQNQSKFSLTLLFIIHLIYILTFLRFYLGGIRIFDIRYSEMFKFANVMVESGSPNGVRIYNDILRFTDRNEWKIEAIYLFIQTILIVSLTFHLSDPMDFIIWYVVLLVLNIFWLVVSRLPAGLFGELFRTEFPELADIPCMKMMFPRRALGNWAVNNTASCLLLLAIWLCLGPAVPAVAHIADGRPAHIAIGACCAVMALNCLIDFTLTWSFYLPQFGEAYAVFGQQDHTAPSHATRAETVTTDSTVETNIARDVTAASRP